MGKDCRVNHQQFSPAVGLTAQQHPAKSHRAVNLQHNFRQLAQRSTVHQGAAQRAHPNVFRNCRLALLVDAVGVNLNLPH